MSAIAEDVVIKVLYAIHEGFDLLDFAGPLEVLHTARHNAKDPDSEAFDITIVGGKQQVMSSQGVGVSAHINWKEAKERIEEFDVLVIPGGGSEAVLEGNLEPIPLIETFVEHQQANPARERTLMSICTGSLFLAKANVLKGLSATTHPSADIKLEKLCQQASAMDTEERTDVMQNIRYVVNNARFSLPEEDSSSDTESTPHSSTKHTPNPFVLTKSEYLAQRAKASDPSSRRRSSARKGSVSFTQSNMRRDSVLRRQGMRLGGLRVITAGGVMSGVDAALYVVSAHVSVESGEAVAEWLQVGWQRGVVVNSVDLMRE